MPDGENPARVAPLVAAVAGTVILLSIVTAVGGLAYVLDAHVDVVASPYVTDGWRWLLVAHATLTILTVMGIGWLSLVAVNLDSRIDDLTDALGEDRAWVEDVDERVKQLERHHDFRQSTYIDHKEEPDDDR